MYGKSIEMCVYVLCMNETSSEVSLNMKSVTQYSKCVTQSWSFKKMTVVVKKRSTRFEIYG